MVIRGTEPGGQRPVDIHNGFFWRPGFKRLEKRARGSPVATRQKKHDDKEKQQNVRSFIIHASLSVLALNNASSVHFLIRLVADKPQIALVEAFNRSLFMIVINAIPKQALMAPSRLRQSGCPTPSFKRKSRLPRLRQRGGSAGDGK